MREIRPNEIIINAKGETRRVSAQERTLYEDKKTPIVDEKRILRHLQEAQALKRRTPLVGGVFDYDLGSAGGPGLPTMKNPMIPQAKKVIRATHQ